MLRFRRVALMGSSLLASCLLLASAASAQQPGVAPPPPYTPVPGPQQPQYAPVPVAPQPQYVPAPQYAPAQPPVYQQPYPQYAQPGYPPPVDPRYAPAAPAYGPGYVPAAPLPTAGPRVIRDWDDSQAIPAGYHVEEHARKGLVIAGAVLFGTTYLISALTAAVDADAHSGSSNPAAALWVPAVGPFIEIAQTSSATAGLFLAIDGLAQVGGVAMFAIGLAAPKTELVRNDFGFHLHLEPMVARDRNGVALVGTF